VRRCSLTDPSAGRRYRLVARLGAGGIGVCYLAETRYGQPVAVKVRRPELADNPSSGPGSPRGGPALTRIRACHGAVIEAAPSAEAVPCHPSTTPTAPSLSEYVYAPARSNPQMAVLPCHRARPRR